MNILHVIIYGERYLPTIDSVACAMPFSCDCDVGSSVFPSRGSSRTEVSLMSAAWADASAFSNGTLGLPSKGMLSENLLVEGLREDRF